jgi:hypothetical protein
VVALSGATASFLAALAVGVAYVLGMVGPLFVIALLWERYDWSNSRLLRGRTLSVRLFGRTRTVHSTGLASGTLLVAIGALVTVLAFTGPDMSSRGWQARFGARLRHYADVTLSWLDAVPGWAWLVVLFVVIALLARRAVDQYLDELDVSEEPESEPAESEEAVLVERPQRRESREQPHQVAPGAWAPAETKKARGRRDPPASEAPPAGRRRYRRGGRRRHPVRHLPVLW